MRLGIRESEGGRQEFPPIHQTTGPVFSIHCDGYSPPPPHYHHPLHLQLHLTDQKAVSFSDSVKKQVGAVL